jgi:hypothetical protein
MRNLIHVIHKSKFKKSKTKSKYVHKKKIKKHKYTTKKNEVSNLQFFTRNESTHERPRVLGVTHTVCALNVS